MSNKNIRNFILEHYVKQIETKNHGDGSANPFYQRYSEA